MTTKDSTPSLVDDKEKMEKITLEDALEEVKEKSEEKSVTNVNSVASEVAELTTTLENLSVNKKDTEKEEKKEKKDEEFKLKKFDLEEVANGIKEGRFKNIIVMSGAGISVAAGIPDFRSPGTGLYDNLKKYQLPFPEAIFEMGYFQNRPEPFYLLAKELYPGTFCPTPTHFFIKLLEEKGLLLRNYTQNIDTLERVAGISADKLVEAHGSFGTSRCIKCKKEVDAQWLKDKVFSDEIPKCESCKGLVKPDIVFFGENLPQRFFTQTLVDFPKCDLLLVLGTSLQVHPFAGLVYKVKPNVPRVLFNNEVVGNFQFESEGNTRDIGAIGDCQEKIKEFVGYLGWNADWERLVEEGKQKQKLESESKL